MAVFISHSFENKPEFDNLADALMQAGVAYWNPDEVKAGSSLRSQLREAVDKCSVCVFIATHRALVSSWCGAELGAFWGAGKAVIVYLADSSLKEDDLPPIVQGDVWERRISRVVKRADELVKEAASTSDKLTRKESTSVGNMTAEQLQNLIVGAFSLAAATTKSGTAGASPEEIGRVSANAVVEGIKASKRSAEAFVESWSKRILWVDDRPDNNLYERHAFESMGFEFTLAVSTKEALAILSKERFAAIISDMGRKEGPQEGYVLLDAIRRIDDKTPVFIYAGSNAPTHTRQALSRGAQGSTNDPQELFEMITTALGNRGNLSAPIMHHAP